MRSNQVDEPTRASGVDADARDDAEEHAVVDQNERRAQGKCDAQRECDECHGDVVGEQRGGELGRLVRGEHFTPGARRTRRGSELFRDQTGRARRVPHSPERCNDRRDDQQEDRCDHKGRALGDELPVPTTEERAYRESATAASDDRAMRADRQLLESDGDRVMGEPASSDCKICRY